MNSIFFNQRGLRAGWRLLVLLGLLACFLFMAFAIRSLLPQARPFSPWRTILNDGFAFLATVAASWTMGRIESRDPGDYGLPLKREMIPRFFTGYVLWGFLPLSLMLLAMRGLGVFFFGPMELHGFDIWIFGAEWTLAFLLVALSEEYMLRGYLLYTLAEGIGFWPAAIVLASVFAYGHSLNGGETVLGIAMTGVYALFASLTVRMTGNLWLAVGAHAGWDWAQTYFYGVNDSGVVAVGHLLTPHTAGPDWLNGGSAGPEGSVLALVVLVAMSAVFAVRYRRKEAAVERFTVSMMQ